MIYVIAGREPEAYEYINRKLEERIRNGESVSKIDDYKYVHSANILRGTINPSGVFVGSWRQRKDIEEIIITLLQRHEPHTPAHETLKRVLIDWEKSMTTEQSVVRASKHLANEIDKQVLQELMNDTNNTLLSDFKIY